MNKKQYKFNKDKKKLIINTHVGKFNLEFITNFELTSDYCKLKQDMNDNPVFKEEGIYCFVTDSTIRYIGKIKGKNSTQNLEKRMYGYFKPNHEHQSTNSNINKILKNSQISLYFLRKTDTKLKLKDIENILIGYCWSEEILNIGV